MKICMVKADSHIEFAVSFSQAVYSTDTQVELVVEKRVIERVIFSSYERICKRWAISQASFLLVTLSLR